MACNCNKTKKLVPRPYSPPPQTLTQRQQVQQIQGVKNQPKRLVRKSS
jgi:hypothetical protein